jgi:signal transduction histidine kinase
MAISARLPAPPQGRAVTNPLSLNRLDTAVARSAAGFGVAFLAQSVPVMMAQLPNMNPWWSLFLVSSLFASLGFAVVASVFGRLVRVAHITFAAVYTVALVSWPFAVTDIAKAPTDSFFLYFLLTIATAMATIGLGARAATAFVVLEPTIYAIIRMTPAGGGVSPIQAALDSVYAIILGGVITIIIIILRRAAISVDTAQQMALRRYTHAVRQHAIESERVQVDSIVHDSVLTTFLSAARAFTPEAKVLAATMASNAIGHLRDAAAVAPDSDAVVAVPVLAGRISDAAGTMSRPFQVRSESMPSRTIPISVAEAVYSAAVQAMVNSLQHAGRDARRWVTVRGVGADAIEVEIGDTGVGFDLDSVPTERLGVRVSILERVLSVGGHVDVDSAPGRGTRVLLRWPEADPTASSEGPSAVSEGVPS